MISMMRMKNWKEDSDNRIISANERDFRILSQNSKALMSQHCSPEKYIDFTTQMNEMIGHQRKDPQPITGDFKL